jgi:photoactive yellow protein
MWSQASPPGESNGPVSFVSGSDDVFELTSEDLDALPFGVVTLDRRGLILRYNRAEGELAARPPSETIGLNFFAEVAPCTNVKAFRGRFDDFALGDESGAECFDFAFLFRWGRHNVSITMLRKAGHEEINILVRRNAVASQPEPGVRAPVLEHGPERSAAVEGSSPNRGLVILPRPTLCRLGGLQEADIRQRIHADDIAAVERVVAAAAAQRQPYAIEYRTVAPDLSPAVVHEAGIFPEPAGVPGYATFVDITARRRREENDWRAARYDSLTGLANREYFLQRVARALQQTGPTVAVLVLDIDRFRETNDVYGRDVGNRLLQLFAQRLADCVSAHGSAAYLGLDIFGVLFGMADTEASIGNAAERLSAELQTPFLIEARPYHLTASIGINTLAGETRDPGVLVRGAYTAMRAAKAGGRNRSRWYSSEMSTHAANQGRRRNELNAALKNGELALHYQPLVDITCDRIVAVESLARWNHPTRGVLPPSEFLELIDHTDFVVAFGEWVLREACRQGRRWCDLGLDIRVCVNVSPLQFRQADFVTLVASILEQSGLPPGRLEIELTEGVMVDGFGEMVERLSRLKALGVRLAIDDFGTGYSSLAYLKYFPVDTLKIDRAFVIDIAADRFDRAIATTVLTLANELGLDCVVEGVETVEQHDTLSAIGCTIMQGYLFGRPMPPDALTALLLGAAQSSAVRPGSLTV